MKRILFLFFSCLLLSINMMAQNSDFEIDDDGVLVAYNGAGGDVVIPEGVTSIGNYAFYGCSGLTSVAIPNPVTSIGYNAFVWCERLASVTIGNSVTSIGYGAFSYCSGLNSITVDVENQNYASENGVLFNKDKTILIQYPGGKSGAYSIPNSVTSIELYAFYGCNSLTSIVIPNSTSNIPLFPCSSLTSIIVDDENQNYASENGVLFNKDKTILIRYPGGKSGAYSIPNSVRYIELGAFQSNGLTSVIIPNSVRYIGEMAFAYCSSLTSISVDVENQNYASENGVLFNKDKTILIVYPGGKSGAYSIPNSVTSIEYYAFANCTGLTAVNIPNSVTSIGEVAFFFCSGLTSVTIPNSVTSIGDRAFAYCSKLQDITVGWTTPLPISSSVFDYINLSACILHVPAGTKALYEVAEVWKDFGNIIENSNQAINLIDQEQIFVSVKDDYIFINSPVAEKINIYSGNGSLLYSTEKPAGAANFNISRIQDKILIIRGSSGWVRKTMK